MIAQQQDPAATSSCTHCGECAGGATAPDARWLENARKARALSWLSLGWMTIEGAVGITAGVHASSIALLGWALSSVVEGLASLIVIWRFTGSRVLSETSERTAQKGVALSFWALAPYVGIEAIRDLVTRQRVGVSRIGMALTLASVLLMPALAIAKRRIGARLSSRATSGEGAQNMLCAYLAGAVLLGLAANAVFGWWWVDSFIAVGIAVQAVREGREAWRGEACC